MKTIFIKAPPNVFKIISSPLLDLRKRLSGKFDYIHLFVLNQTEFHKQFPKLKNHLGESGMLWVSWPKAGANGTDLSMKVLNKLGYEYGLVESKAISINEVWSALKFTWPKKGVVYKKRIGKG